VYVYICVCLCNECIYMLQDKHINSRLDCFRFELTYLITQIINFNNNY